MSSKPSFDLACAVQGILAVGKFPNRKITLVDPDDPREMVIYEDIDQEALRQPRLALVTIEPDRSKAIARGDMDHGVVTVTHEHALRDMKIMIERFGYIVKAVEKDLP